MQFQQYDNSANTQRQRIVRHFEKCPQLSTMEAREQMGILHPCGRIMELRRRGYRIDMRWIYRDDANGVSHRVGQYIFHGKE